jgi:aldehyde dehydrogenase (NAD+)
LDWVTRCIASGVDEGARLVCGGDRPGNLGTGYYLRPAVFADVDNTMQIARVEVFGPVAAVIPFDGSEETAVQLANNSQYGLAGYVWTKSMEKGLRVAQRLRAGTIAINAPMVRDHRTPFGGYKHSGIGRTGGRHSIELFTELKTTCLPISPYVFPKLGAN